MGTTLKIVNGEYFPVHQSSSWRKHNEFSYKAYDNFNRIKVFNQEDNRVYLLSKKNLDDLSIGDTNLIFIPKQHIGGRSWHHIEIATNNKIHDNSLARFTINDIKGSKIMASHNYSKEPLDYSHGDFYQIFSIFETDF